MSNDANQHQFVTGAVIGFLAAASSHWLTQTKPGQEAKDQFQQVWAEAEANLPQISQLKLGDLSLEQLFDVIFTDQDWDQLTASSDKQAAKSQSKPLIQRKARARKKKKQPKKFVGV
jgi:hypothetical protein